MFCLLQADGFYLVTGLCSAVDANSETPLLQVHYCTLRTEPNSCFTIDRLLPPALVLRRRHPKRRQVERGLGDDQSPRGMWGDLDPWLASLCSSLLRLKPLPSGTVIDDTLRLEPPLFAMTPVAVAAGDGDHTSIAAGGGGRGGQVCEHLVYISLFSFSIVSVVGFGALS